jgi:plastocyanin
MRRTTLALIIVATLGLRGACGDDDTATPDTEGGSTIAIETFIFSPDPLTVPAGTTVTFENSDTTTHSATAGTRDEPEVDEFDIELPPDGTGEVTLDEPGTYAYFCRFHSGEGMTGEIIVE